MGMARDAVRGGRAVAPEALAPLAAALAHVAEAAWTGPLGPGRALFQTGSSPAVPPEAVLAAVAVRRGTAAAGWVRAATAEPEGAGMDDATLAAWLQGVGDALGGIFGQPVAVEPTAAPQDPEALGAVALTFAYTFGQHTGTAWLWLEPGLLQACVAALAAPPRQDPFPPLPGEAEGQATAGIDLLLDVPLEISVELGRTQRPIRDVLALVPGSVIELDGLAGEPIDVLVNGRRIARAEVVVVDERFAIRITDILSPEERVLRLG